MRAIASFQSRNNNEGGRFHGHYRLLWNNNSEQISLQRQVYIALVNSFHRNDTLYFMRETETNHAQLCTDYAPHVRLPCDRSANEDSMPVPSQRSQVQSEDADDTLIRLYRDGSVADRCLDRRISCSNTRPTVRARLSTLPTGSLLSILFARTRTRARARTPPQRRSRSHPGRMQRRTSHRHWRYPAYVHMGAEGSERHMVETGHGELWPGMVRLQRRERISIRLLPRRARWKGLQGCRVSLQGAR
jgi:hypothetical protein